MMKVLLMLLLLLMLQVVLMLLLLLHVMMLMLLCDGDRSPLVVSIVVVVRGAMVQWYMSIKQGEGACLCEEGRGGRETL